MVEVPLRARDGSVRAVALIDDEDAEWVLAHRWYLQDGYARRNVWPDGKYGRCIAVQLHRLLLGLEHGDPREGDHVNRDTLDNRRSNLRIATHAQNMQNVARSGNRGSSSRYRGVGWSKPHRKWKAQAQIGGRKYYLGLFDEEDEAARAVAAFRAEHMPFTVEALA